MRTALECHPQDGKAGNAQLRHWRRTYDEMLFQVSAAAFRIRNEDVAPGS